MKKLERKTENVDDVNSIAQSIMNMIKRDTIKEYSFLGKPLFSLELKSDNTVKTIGANYTHLWYNPEWVLDTYAKKNGRSDLVVQTAHCVLHCLMLHPSMVTQNDNLFNLCADLAINTMLYNDDMSRPLCLFDAASMTNGMSLTEMMENVQSNTELRKAIMKTAPICNDDHSVWFRTEKDEQGNPLNSEEQAAVLKLLEQEWSKMLTNSKYEATSSRYGTEHGDIFQSIRKPNRHSKFTYKDYIRRFAKREIAREDLETMDMAMYNWGIENLGDIPIVEFSESKEAYEISDIIIAIDMSGSCSGVIAANFLRQLYTLFEEMNIAGNVHLHVVTFDTQIVRDFLIKTKSDADKLLEEYPSDNCWGGTDFNCVFNYANNFSKNNRGKKLKALFFFSDGQGAFPASPTKYPTTFFIPEENFNSPFAQMESTMPKWVEVVKYDDRD